MKSIEVLEKVDCEQMRIPAYSGSQNYEGAPAEEHLGRCCALERITLKREPRTKGPNPSPGSDDSRTDESRTVARLYARLEQREVALGARYHNQSTGSTDPFNGSV